LVSKVRIWKEMAGLSVLLFVVAIGAGAFCWSMLSGGGFASPLAMFQAFRRDQTTEIQEPVKPAEPVARRALDGKPLTAPDTSDYAAVMIDNMSPARPASGLSKAVLVIEAPVESSITRFLAYFDLADDVPKIGPVRSVRPYYLDWAAEADAMITHVGGSPEALTKLAASDARDLNEFSAGVYFWRDKERYAPHNAYTSTELMREAVANRYDDHVLAPVAPWKFKDDLAHAEAGPSMPATKAPTLRVDYRAPAYDVEWIYDAAANDYVRVQGGAPQADGATALRAKNVAVQFVTTKVLDAVGRRSVDTTGPGEASVFIDGTRMDGTWTRSGGRTRFLGPDGSEIVFNAGTTWIQVVPIGTELLFRDQR
jgi:hypothetical protein